MGKIEGSQDFQIWWCVNFDASCYKKKAKKLGKIGYFMIQQLLPVASTLMLKKAKNLGKIEGSHDIQVVARELVARE